MKRAFLALLAGTVVNFLLGFLIYALLLRDFMAENTRDFEGLMTEPGGAWPGYILSSVLFSAMIVFILRRTRKVTAAAGFVVSAVVSFFIAVSFDVMFYYGMNLYTFSYLVTDVIAYTVMGAATGLVIGAILPRKGLPE